MCSTTRPIIPLTFLTCRTYAVGWTNSRGNLSHARHAHFARTLGPLSKPNAHKAPNRNIHTSPNAKNTHTKKKHSTNCIHHAHFAIIAQHGEFALDSRTKSRKNSQRRKTYHRFAVWCELCVCVCVAAWNISGAFDEWSGSRSINNPKHNIAHARKSHGQYVHTYSNYIICTRAYTVFKVYIYICFSARLYGAIGLKYIWLPVRLFALRVVWWVNLGVAHDIWTWPLMRSGGTLALANHIRHTHDLFSATDTTTT